MKAINNLDRVLFCCLLFIITMIGIRIKYSGSIRFIFLIWNLFLAYIPFFISKFFNFVLVTHKWKQTLLFTSWLLFFPNALYVITDIIHLQEVKPVPVIFDAILLFTASLVGLILAFASLMHVEIFLKKIFSKKIIKPIMFILLFAGAFGVYLGRFQRWNSWNVVDNPFALFIDISQRFIHPLAHVQSWTIVFFLTVTYTLCWLLFKNLTKINFADFEQIKKSP